MRFFWTMECVFALTKKKLWELVEDGQKDPFVVA